MDGSTSAARLIRGLASRGPANWDFAEAQAPHVQLRPQSAATTSLSLKKCSTSAAAVSPTRPSTARIAYTRPPQWPSLASLPSAVEAADDVPRIRNLKAEHQLEFRNTLHYEVRQSAASSAVGPLSYRAENAWVATQPRTPRCSFSTEKRLSIGDSEKRPRCAHLPGKGHWLDGMATGTTIPGIYNRFRHPIPGPAAYDVADAVDRIAPRSPRATFGTTPRFYRVARAAKTAKVETKAASGKPPKPPPH